MASKLIKAAALCAFFAVFFYTMTTLLLNNINYPGLWYDESQQFWNSLGEYAGTPSDKYSLAAVFWGNTTANTDPGGFTLLLHYWMKITGTDIVSLRLLPYSIFLLTFLAFAMLVQKISQSWLFGFASASLLFTDKQLLRYMFEFRPYGLEVLGVILSCYYLWEIRQRLNERAFWRLGIILALFLTTRYSFFLVTGAFCSALVVILWQERRFLSWKEINNNLGALMLPIIIVSGAIAYFIIPRHIKLITGWAKLDNTFENLSAPDYLKGNVLDGFFTARAATFAKQNFFGTEGIWITIGAALLLVCLFLEFIKRNPTVKRILASVSPFYAFLFLPLLTHLLGYVASALGYYPWKLNTQWTLYMSPLNFLVLVILALIAINLLREFLPERIFSRGMLVKHASTAVLCVLLLFGAREIYSQRDFKKTYWSDISAVLYYLVKQPGPFQVYVTAHEYPTVHYFLKYGPLTPNFKLNWFRQATVNGGKKHCYDFYIAPSGLRFLHDKFKHRKFRQVKGIQPAHLYTSYHPECLRIRQKEALAKRRAQHLQKQRTH